MILFFAGAGLLPAKLIANSPWLRVIDEEV
jgi:hypothetical protein